MTYGINNYANNTAKVHEKVLCWDLEALNAIRDLLNGKT